MTKVAYSRALLFIQSLECTLYSFSLVPLDINFGAHALDNIGLSHLQSIVWCGFNQIIDISIRRVLLSSMSLHKDSQILCVTLSPPRGFESKPEVAYLTIYLRSDDCFDHNKEGIYAAGVVWEVFMDTLICFDRSFFFSWPWVTIWIAAVNPS